MVVGGAVVCILSILAASFVNSVTGLILTQGVMFGLAFLVLYIPMLYMLNEWFVEKRGLAYGVLYAGAGVSGTGIPFLLQWLLASYGRLTTLRIVAITQVILIAPTLPFLKGRLPPSPYSAVQPIDLTFFKKHLFWVFAFSNICQGLAYYIPPLYLPTYASALGLSGTVGALILAANNLACVLGQISFGHLTDRFQNVYILVAATTLIASLATFTLWGFSHSLATLLIFSIVYGWSAGSYIVFWPKYGSMLSEDPQPVYTLMAFGKGVGNIVTGPISSSLLTGFVSSSGYGLNKFAPAIIFVGTLWLCSSISVATWPLKRFLLPCVKF
jgi:MFS family permease